MDGYQPTIETALRGMTAALRVLASLVTGTPPHGMPEPTY